MFERLTSVAQHRRRALPFIAGFAVIGTALLLSARAAPAGTATINFANLDDQPNFYPYEQSHIKIQRNGGSADDALLNAINTQHERAFVRLDKWKPTANSPLNTDPGNRYDLGDRFIDNANANGRAIWITQEVSKWKTNQHNEYFLSPPLSNQELNQYEDMWYDIVRYIKERSPQTEIVEMMNEPNLSKFKLTDDDAVNLYVRNARVVNRINSDLNLPNGQFGPKLISGGPSFTFNQHVPPNGGTPGFQYWVDQVYAQPDFDQIKPAFYSFHRFNPAARPDEYALDPQVIRDYLSLPKFNGDWDDVPLWASAYNNYDGNYGDRDPTAQDMASTAAGVAAVHYLYMEENVEYSSFFAQSAYNAFQGSVLLPEGQQHDISYYAPGKKTPMYNYFLMMSMIDGQRVSKSLNLPNNLSNGLGVGVDAIRGNNKAWILAWNYHNSSFSTTHNRPMTFDLSGLSAAGINNNESATVKIYAIDQVNSNVGHGNHNNDDLVVVDTIQLAAGSNRSINYDVDINQILLFEITGDNNSGGGGDTTSPTVTWESPSSHSTLSGNATLTASASDNVGVDRVEFEVDGSVIGTDTTATNGDYSVVFDTTSLSNGNHDFRAVAYDAAGNSANSQTRTLNIDNSGSGGQCSAVTPPSGNIAPNYSYETPNANLNPIGSATYSWPAGDANSGNCAAQISSSNNGANSVDQRYVIPLGDMPVTPGAQYDVSGWIKTIGANDGAHIRVNFWSGTSGSDFISGSNTSSNDITGTQDWTQVTIPTVTAPGGAQFARVELRLAGSGTALFDDVAVCPSTASCSVSGGGDTIPPTVNITTANNSVFNGMTALLSATANDNVNVNRVEFRINGSTVGSDTTSPYEHSWDVGSSTTPNGDYSLTATAFDDSSNQTSSSVTTVRVRNVDINRSGQTDIFDLASLLARWQTTNDSVHDLNGNGLVDIIDLSILLNQWGQ